MSVGDPIGDMLTRIMNAVSRRKPTVEIPWTRTCEALARLLLAENFLEATEIKAEGKLKQMVLTLKMNDGLPAISRIKRLSKPGVRQYRGADELPRVRGGLGMVAVSTPKGIMSASEARKKNLGGEILCELW